LSKLHWLALMTVPGIGGVTARAILDRFGTIEAVFEAPASELEGVPRCGAQLARVLPAASLDAMEDELVSLGDEGIQVVTWDDDTYPANLRSIPDSPPLLFVRGELRPEDDLAVAVVGTRQPSATGEEIARRLALDLASRGIAVVSGLAQGIDTCAHLGSLESEGGRTIAVLGSGLRNVTPVENRALADRVGERGAVLSEVRPDVAPRGTTLMARDRIISGLSRAVIVVEAAERSGSVDTAVRALRQKRRLLAIPGSPGTRFLIEQGAEALEADGNLDALCEWVRAHRPEADEAQISLFAARH
jgi:DNA processing protein